MAFWLDYAQNRMCTLGISASTQKLCEFCKGATCKRKITAYLEPLRFLLSRGLRCIVTLTREGCFLGIFFI